MMLYAAELAHEGILTASVHPGVVETDMALDIFRRHPEAKELADRARIQMISAQQSAESVMTVVDGLTKEQSGHVLSYSGEVMPF